MNPGKIILRPAHSTGLLFLAALLIWTSATRAWGESAPRAPDLVLTGSFSGKDHQTYRDVAFVVPTGVQRLTLEFSYSGKGDHTTLDIGLKDPLRFRGWSGGNKSRVVIEDGLATPSYLPGPIPAGAWKLIIGIPNIRKDARSDYMARVWFDRAGAAFPGFADQSLEPSAKWYRGDLHAHTAHSDGSCLSVGGRRIPCPVFRTLEAARSRGLDFLAITDHNAVSQDQALAELAPYFDDLLLIPGREITTFQGHANVWGPTADLPFQLGSRKVPDFDVIQTQAHAAHGLVSINHPRLPSGEACMGCGWTAPTDWSKVDAIEVVNGGALAILGPEGPMSGVPFWEDLLNRGYRITAVGGSDNHDPDLPIEKPGALGRPVTYVHAGELSQARILEAIGLGRVFIDVYGLSAPRLEVQARSGAQSVEMGGALILRTSDKVILRVSTGGLPQGAKVQARGPAVQGLGQRAWPASGDSPEITLTYDGKASWLRFDVRDAQGALILLGNPVYLRSAP